MNVLKLSLVLLAGVSIASNAMAAEKKSTDHRKVGLAGLFRCPTVGQLAHDPEKNQDVVAVNMPGSDNWHGSFQVSNGEEKFPQLSPEFSELPTITATPALKPYTTNPTGPAPDANASYTFTCKYPKGENFDSGVMSVTLKNDPTQPWQYGCFMVPGITDGVNCL